MTTPPQTHIQLASIQLAEARLKQSTLHHPGVRDRYRAQLEHIIALVNQALISTHLSNDLIQHAQEILLEAHTARAEDARYGAGQLSRGSQRAPTREDCEDGWQRVEGIVTNAETSAQHAQHLASILTTPRAKKWAHRASIAATKARQIIDQRNHAYTFHTNPTFSFGEGWYVAASALLGGARIQIEPDQPHTSRATKFLHDAGLSASITPYRSRPRANKQLTAIVADAFRNDPSAAQHAIRTSFLGGPPKPAITTWTQHRVGIKPGKKILLWIRHGSHDPERNTDYKELVELSRHALDAQLTPILFGDALRGGPPPKGCIDLTLAWKEAIFQGEDMRRAQLQLFETLRQHHGLVGQLGVTTAGMDGPALLGLPTMYLTQTSNVRMRRWVGVIPGYQEVVQDQHYLDTIRQTLRAWAKSPEPLS